MIASDLIRSYLGPGHGGSALIGEVMYVAETGDGLRLLHPRDFRDQHQYKFDCEMLSSRKGGSNEEMMTVKC